MTDDQSRDGGDADRVVSRRVDNPTEATAEDERSYAAADADPGPAARHPAPDSDGTTERADRDMATESDEPTRSE
jgi:hypothetical protein